MPPQGQTQGLSYKDQDQDNNTTLYVCRKLDWQQQMLSFIHQFQLLAMLNVVSWLNTGSSRQRRTGFSLHCAECNSPAMMRRPDTPLTPLPARIG